MPSSTIRADARVRAVPWRDLLQLTWAEKVWELMLPLPWLVGSLVCYHLGYWPLGAVGSFYFSSPDCGNLTARSIIPSVSPEPCKTL